MSHQEALTVIANISQGRVDPLKKMLGSIRAHGGDWNIVPFAKLPRVHFARFVVFDATQDLKGNPLPAQLALLTHVDAPLAEHLDPRRNPPDRPGLLSRQGVLGQGPADRFLPAVLTL